MTRLIQIGNSKGIRIPKPLVKQAKLEDIELELVLVEGGLLIAPVRHKPRANWKAQIEAALANQDETLDHEWLEAPLTNDEDWEW